MQQGQTALLTIAAGGVLSMLGQNTWGGTVHPTATVHFGGGCGNAGILFDNVTFRDGSSNWGTVGNNATFDDWTSNAGTCGNGTTFKGMSRLGDYSGLGGICGDNTSFLGSSQWQSGTTGGGTVWDSDGMFGGGSYESPMLNLPAGSCASGRSTSTSSRTRAAANRPSAS